VVHVIRVCIFSSFWRNPFLCESRKIFFFSKKKRERFLHEKTSSSSKCQGQRAFFLPRAQTNLQKSGVVGATMRTTSDNNDDDAKKKKKKKKKTSFEKKKKKTR